MGIDAARGSGAVRLAVGRTTQVADADAASMLAPCGSTARGMRTRPRLACQSLTTKPRVGQPVQTARAVRSEHLVPGRIAAPQAPSATQPETAHADNRVVSEAELLGLVRQRGRGSGLNILVVVVDSVRSALSDLLHAKRGGLRGCPWHGRRAG
jgi:hypothetical protein